MEHIPSPSSTAGPFLHLGLTEKHSITKMAARGLKGEHIIVRCRIFDADGLSVNDAMIELWQADSEGRYRHPDDPRASECDPAFTGFGRSATNGEGWSEFETIMPGAAQTGNGKTHAPHINVAIYSRGLLLPLYTRMYFAGIPANEEDAVLALVPKERCATLMAQPDPARVGRWLFDIRLRGENETVFFDV